ncbi:MAG: lipopolysaccharide biosynthesis protein [Actinomycetota bacterium]|nr:lipopolysaccharide biosynthesis protein [Actinomycetota bacterium]
MSNDSPVESEAIAQDPGDPGLRRAAAGGVMWQGLSYFLGKALVLVSTAILARLLTVEEFGLVGLALVFITYAEVLTDLGVAQALVYFPRTDRRIDSAVALSLVSSLALVGAALLAAPYVADYFDEPEVTGLFRLLSLSLFLGGLGQVPDALIRKELRFKNRLIMDLLRAVGQGAVSIGLAVAGYGAVAIVWGYLAGNLLRTAAAWVLVDHRPRLSFGALRGEEAGPLLRYGVAAAGNGLLLSLVFNIDYLIVGKVLGTDALGFYALAFRLPQMAIINVFHVLSSVAFPLFSKARDDHGKLVRGYLTSVRIQTVFGVGAGVLLAVVAPSLVEVVFGVPKWSPSIVPLQALALYASFRSLGIGAVDLYKGIGRPGLALGSSVVRLAVLLPALLVATDWGIEGVSWAQAGVALALAAMMQIVAARVLSLSVVDLAGALWPSLAVGVAAFGGAGAVHMWLPGPAVARLAFASLAGLVCGWAALWLTDKKLLTELRQMTRRGPATGLSPTV